MTDVLRFYKMLEFLTRKYPSPRPSPTRGEETFPPLMGGIKGGGYIFTLCFYTCTSLILERSSTPSPNAAAVEIYLGSRFACFKEGSLISLRFSSIIVWHIRSSATGSLPTIIPL